LAQRLVRVVCEHCKKMAKPTVEEMKGSALDPALWSQVLLASGTGCLECAGSGYHGRAAISELLDLTDNIREMIINRRPTSEIKRAAKDSGMTFLRDAGLAMVRRGITTLKEINKVTFIE
jgi:type IV pilus assembly protein PilB